MPAATTATTTRASGLRLRAGPGGGADGGTVNPGAPVAPPAFSSGGSGVPWVSSADIKQSPPSTKQNYSSYKAKRFKNDSQFEISVKRPITSNIPSAIIKAPLATSIACMCERKRL